MFNRSIVTGSVRRPERFYGLFRGAGYFPVIAFHQTVIISKTILGPSLSGLMRVPSRCDHATGTSAIVKPKRFARNNSSGSNPQRSTFCSGKIASIDFRVNALNPHCVSLNGSASMVRKRRLKARPKSWRYNGWRFLCSFTCSQREPIAISAPWPIASKSFSASPIGEERSASLKSASFPVACNMPLRTL